MTEFPFMAGFASAAGVLAFFGGIALIILAGSKAKVEERKLEMEKQQLKHQERLKALETGRPVPDADVEMARAEAEATRARAAACVGVFVPLGLVGAATLTTLVMVGAFKVWSETTYPHQANLAAALLYTIWGVCGLVSLVTVASSLGVMARRPAGSGPSRRDAGRIIDVQPADR